MGASLTKQDNIRECTRCIEGIETIVAELKRVPVKKGEPLPKPTSSQQSTHAAYYRCFKYYYKQLLNESEADALITRFAKVQKVWNQHINPESYTYLYNN